MEKRIKFKCWNCQREYSLLQQVEGNPKLFVECPFCGAEGIADLAPYRTKNTTVMRGGEGDIPGFSLPDVLPTRPRED
ncbi:MAG: hypothetical protein H6667_10290 [Ardenticatenaceae bacterium]|nr:hypothetical protein [Ardenticatenaceae bacterium]MCB9446423.1 hypothetical protein [Ardenticatenaceae bacterium]